MTRLVEVVGPPGSGKSTLLAELVRTGRVELVGSARSAATPRLRVATAVAGGRALVGATLAWGRPPPSRQVARWCVRLGAFEPLLTADRAGAPVTVVDQGPVYTLSRLAGQSPARRGTNWWSARVATWAHRLDAVVVLDADDEILRTRIDERAKTHALRGEPPERAVAEINRQRLALERTVFHLCGLGLPVARLATDTGSPAELGRRLDDLLGRPPDPGPPPSRP